MRKLSLLEQVKKYWNKKPCNILHSDKEIGSINYFNEVETRKYFVEPHIPGFADFKKWKGKNVLEIGCGIGTDTINFARAGANVTAVDLSNSSLIIARKRAQVFGLTKRISFYQADAEKLSKFIPVAPYDLVYSFGVIHHTPNPENVIKEIHKFVHLKSQIRIMLYYKYSWKVFWIILKYGHGAFWKANSLIKSYSEATIGSPVSFVYSKKQVRTLMKDFEIFNMQVTHIFPYNIDRYRRYIYQKTWYWQLVPDMIFKWLERNFGWHLLIKAKPMVV